MRRNRAHAHRRRQTSAAQRSKACRNPCRPAIALAACPLRRRQPGRRPSHPQHRKRSGNGRIRQNPRSQRNRRRADRPARPYHQPRHPGTISTPGLPKSRRNHLQKSAEPKNRRRHSRLVFHKRTKAICRNGRQPAHPQSRRHLLPTRNHRRN